MSTSSQTDTSWTLVVNKRHKSNTKNFFINKDSNNPASNTSTKPCTLNSVVPDTHSHYEVITIKRGDKIKSITSP
jgi:hypothetical protein